VSFVKFLLPLSLVLIASSSFAGGKGDDRVWIARPDGSRQCDEKDGTPHDPIAEAKEELTKKGIHVLEAKKRNDGRIRAQMCGISTGNETSFLIPKKELAKAQTLGFKPVR
jgi:hypothetical protein